MKNNENKLGYVEVILPENICIDGVMGDGVKTVWIPKCSADKFEKCEPTINWSDPHVNCTDQAILDKLCDIADLAETELTVIPTEQCVTTPGPYCGAQVIIFMDTEGNQIKRISDPVTCEIIDIPPDLEIGPCRDDLFEAQYEYVTITSQFCSNDVAGITHTQAEMLNIINSSGECFNVSGTVVDLSQPSQEIVNARVQTYAHRSQIKKSDGTIFSVVDDTACVLGKNADVLFQLQSGGSFQLGDAFDNLNNVVEIDESVVWPCGTGGIYCFTVRNTITNAKT